MLRGVGHGSVLIVALVRNWSSMFFLSNMHHDSQRLIFGLLEGSPSSGYF